MGLTRERVPNFVTALYLTLTLTCLYYAFTPPHYRDDEWGMALMFLTFPFSFLSVFVYFVFDLYVVGNELFFVWLFLVFTAANAFILHRVSRHICGED
jgi:prepilin signal peptidase PulO-like enzyme (type II secretory pathway)